MEEENTIPPKKPKLSSEDDSSASETCNKSEKESSAVKLNEKYLIQTDEGKKSVFITLRQSQAIPSKAELDIVLLILKEKNVSGPGWTTTLVKTMGATDSDKMYEGGTELFWQDKVNPDLKTTLVMKKLKVLNSNTTTQQRKAVPEKNLNASIVNSSETPPLEGQTATMPPPQAPTKAIQNVQKKNSLRIENQRKLLQKMKEDKAKPQIESSNLSAGGTKALVTVILPKPSAKATLEPQKAIRVTNISNPHSSSQDTLFVQDIGESGNEAGGLKTFVPVVKEKSKSLVASTKSLPCFHRVNSIKAISVGNSSVPVGDGANALLNNGNSPLKSVSVFDLGASALLNNDNSPLKSIFQLCFDVTTPINSGRKIIPRRLTFPVNVSSNLSVLKKRKLNFHPQLECENQNYPDLNRFDMPKLTCLSYQTSWSKKHTFGISTQMNMPQLQLMQPNGGVTVIANNNAPSTVIDQGIFTMSSTADFGKENGSSESFGNIRIVSAASIAEIGIPLSQAPTSIARNESSRPYFSKEGKKGYHKGLFSKFQNIMNLGHFLPVGWLHILTSKPAPETLIMYQLVSDFNSLTICRFIQLYSDGSIYICIESKDCTDYFIKTMTIETNEDLKRLVTLVGRSSVCPGCIGFDVVPTCDSAIREGRSWYSQNCSRVLPNPTESICSNCRALKNILRIEKKKVYRKVQEMEKDRLAKLGKSEQKTDKFEVGNALYGLLGNFWQELKLDEAAKKSQEQNIITTTGASSI